jgi:LPS-assembly lipoprotein
MISFRLARLIHTAGRKATRLDAVTLLCQGWDRLGGNSGVKRTDKLNRSRASLVAAVLACLVVSGCGFEPLLGRSQSAYETQESLAAIRIPPLNDRSGQILRNALLDQLTPLGQPAKPRFVLSIRLTEPRQTLLLRRDDIISRSSYSAQAAFELRDTEGRLIFSGGSVFTTDYEIASSEYATRVSLEDARDRVMVLVATDIRSQITQRLKQNLSNPR